jgi:hypothetical protein
MAKVMRRMMAELGLSRGARPGNAARRGKGSLGAAASSASPTRAPFGQTIDFVRGAKVAALIPRTRVRANRAAFMTGLL